MICIESVGKATSFNLAVLAVSHHGPLAVEDDDPVQRVVFQLDKAQAYLSFNLVVEADCLGLRDSLLHLYSSPLISI